MRKRCRRIIAFMMAFSMCISMIGGVAYGGEILPGMSSDIQIVQQGARQYYLADSQDGEVAGPENFDVWTQKTIAGTENEDEFEVTLQVGSTVKAIPNDAAVVLVMDVSGSMMNDETGERWNWNNMPEGRKRRIEYTREAAIEFAEAFVKDAGNSQRMLSVVQFGNTAQTVLPWTDVNNGGELKDVAKDALESVQVNFTIDPARYYWNEEAAMAKWSKVDYWDTTEVPAEMQDEFRSYYVSYCQEASLTNHFQSYLTAETVTQEIEGVPTEVEITGCTYPECMLTDEHTHCGYEGCTVSEAHSHCDLEGCAVTAAHLHCSKCDVTAEHMHCDYADCISEDEHMHCSHEGCTAAETHFHCKRCGLTDANHTHVAGCTLGECLAPYEGPHTHCCTHSCDTILSYTKHHQSWVDYNYRCKNPDPTHTHEFTDSDTAYLTYTRYFGSVWCIGTNMEAGLMLARNLVTTGLEEGGAIEDLDNVYVILLSDGKPTWRTDETSTTEVEFIGQANNDGTWPALKDIVVSGEEGDIAIAEDIKEVAELYAILYSNDLESKFSLESNHPLNGVSGADWISGSGDYYIGADYVIDSPAADGIEAAFMDINDHIDVLAKAWVVNDALSSAVTFMEFTQNGTYCSVAPAEFGTDSSIYWNIGRGEPESGTGGMADPYIYTMKYKVKLNSSQGDVRDASLSYDAGTSQEGVWTGKDTILQYFMVEKDEADSMTPEEIQEKLRTAHFSDVSVKGLYGDLSFVKKHGETGAPMEGVGFCLYLADGSVYGSEILADSEGRVTFTDVPKNTYVLKETTVPNGMEPMSDLVLVEEWGHFLQNDGTAVPGELLNWPEGKSPENPLPPNNPPGNGDSDSLPPDNPQEEPPVEEMRPDELVEIPDEDVPASDMPAEELIEVPESTPPLSDIPKTGDTVMMWIVLAAISGTVLIGIYVFGRKGEIE